MNRVVNFIALVALVFAVPAWAATESTTMNITTNVTADCSVSSNGLDFGEYDPFATSALDGTTTITVFCTQGTGFTVGLNAGQGAGATISVRKMSQESGNDKMNYYIYSDSSRTQIWGDTVGTNTVSGTTEGTLTVYGRIPAGQILAADFYDDTVTVVVTY